MASNFLPMKTSLRSICKNQIKYVIGYCAWLLFNAMSATFLTCQVKNVPCKMCCRPLHSVSFRIERNNTSCVNVVWQVVLLVVAENSKI